MNRKKEVIEVVVGTLVLVGMVEVLCSVRMSVVVGGVGSRGGGVMSGGGNASVAGGGADVGVGGGEGLGGEILAASPMGFLESYGKTSHIVAHSCLISAISFCRLACKEEVV